MRKLKWVPPVFLSVILLVLSIPMVSFAAYGDVTYPSYKTSDVVLWYPETRSTSNVKLSPVRRGDAFSTSNGSMIVGRTYEVTINFYTPTKSSLTGGSGNSTPLSPVVWFDPDGHRYSSGSLSTSYKFTYVCDSLGTWTVTFDVQAYASSGSYYEPAYQINWYNVQFKDVTPKTMEEMVDSIDKNLDEGIHGYDNSAAASDNERLDSQYQEYQQAEDNLINNIDVNYDFGGNPFLQFPAAAQLISATIAGYLSAIGDFYTVIVVVFAISVVMFILGRRKGG